MKKYVVVGIIMILLLAGNLALFMSLGPSQTQGKDAQSDAPKGIHAPIRIDSDADFANLEATDQYVTGDGSASHPYNITDMNINANGGGAAIYIGNVTKNFTIYYGVFYGALYGGSVYNVGGGIVLYNIKGQYVHIEKCSISSNDYGIYMNDISSNTEISIGTYGKSNQIYENHKDGVTVTNSAHYGIIITYNVIFQNHVGVNLSQNPQSSGFVEVGNNGISLNDREGVRIVQTNDVSVYENLFYKNDGSTDKYDENHPQATQDSSSYVNWYWGYSENKGNFWYDWAMNNNTNYDMSHNNFVIPWKYPIKDVNDYSVVRNNDSFPLKGIHHDALKIEELLYDTTLTPQDGYVGFDHTGAYVFTGLEINGTIGNSPAGYGLYFNGLNINDKLRIDGMIIHNVSLASTAHWTLMGNGLLLNNTNMISIYVSHMDIYNCHANGIGVNHVSADVLIDDTWIHDGASGATGLFPYSDNEKLFMFNSTIEHQGHWGVYMGGNNVNLSLYNNIIAYNLRGIAMASGLDNVTIHAYYNSFFKNSEYGFSLKRNTKSNMSFANNVFYENNGAGDTYSSSHVQVYAEQYSNFSNYDINTHTRGNYYHEWVNNNGSNDKNNDGVVDWEYKFYGGSIGDNSPKIWVDFMGVKVYQNINGYDHIVEPEPIYANHYNLEHLNDRGTSYGIVGYDGTDYYIIGWHKTKNYTDSSNTYGIYLDTVRNKKSFKIYNVKVDNANEGMNIWYVNEVNIENAEVTKNDMRGITITEVPSITISHSKIHGNFEGIEFYFYDGGGNIYENQIYKNGDTGISFLLTYSPTSNFFIHNNYIYGNQIGIYGSKLAKTYIRDNGFAYNSNYGVELKNSNGNYVYNNTFYYNNGTSTSYSPNNPQAYDDGTNYWSYTTEGNYWHDFSMNNNTNDNNRDLIIDYPYSIAGGSNKDEHPYLLRRHEPIRIDSSEDFDWGHGYIGGGLDSHPYTFVGWYINGSGKGFGMYMGNVSKSVMFDHCYFVSVSGGASTYQSNSGLIIYKYSGWDMTIENVVSENNSGSGTFINDGVGISIIKSYFENNGIHGIYATDTGYLEITNSNMSNNLEDGFHADGCGELSIENNMFYENGANGTWFYQTSTQDSDYESIYNNTYINNAKYGVALVGTDGYIVYNNTFVKNNGASDNGTYDPAHAQAYDDEGSDNSWNTDSQGNCWSDYNGSGYYDIAGSTARDNRPNSCTTVPELNVFLVAILLVVAMGIAVRRRKH